MLPPLSVVALFVAALSAVDAAFTDAQVEAIRVTPKVTGFLSIVGSCLICYLVLKLPRSKRNVYQHLIVTMSIMDVFGSLAFFMSSWMTVAGGGTTATCSLQGFILQLNFAVPLFNGVLAFNFLLRIKYSYTELQTAKLLKFYFAVGWIFPVVTAFVALGLEQYNDSGPWCWIAPFPAGCVDSGPDANCTRGINWRIYQFAFFYIPLWMSMLFTCWCMSRIARHVSVTESGATKYRGGASNGSNQTSAGALVKKQAMLYSACFLLTWIFGTANRVSQLFVDAQFPLVWLHSFFVPLQGFLNSVVYLHPKYVRWKSNTGGGLVMLCCNTLSDCYYFLVGVGENPSKGLHDENGDGMDGNEPTEPSFRNSDMILDEDELVGRRDTGHRKNVKRQLSRTRFSKHSEERRYNARESVSDFSKSYVSQRFNSHGSEVVSDFVDCHNVDDPDELAEPNQAVSGMVGDEVQTNARMDVPVTGVSSETEAADNHAPADMGSGPPSLPTGDARDASILIPGDTSPQKLGEPATLDAYDDDDSSHGTIVDDEELEVAVT